MIDVAEIVMQAYPKVTDCSHGHIGETVLTFFEEPADDRTYLMVVARCGHCNMPNGADDYADQNNQERFYAGLEPVAQ